MVEETQPDDMVPPEDGAPASAADELTDVREQLEEALREKDQFRSIAQRAQADLVNFKRRAADEQDELRRNANSELLLRMLTVIDDLNRAIDLVPGGEATSGWVEGLQLVQRNFNNILDSRGVTKIEAGGRPFQPSEHEAVFFEEIADTKEGIVVKVIRDGYKLHDRVLRAAQVAVSKAPGPASEPDINREET